MYHARKTLLILLAVGAAFACGAPDRPLAPIQPIAAAPTYAKINATDSLLMLTNILYSDTAIVLQRTTPLAADIATSGVIGRSGGELSIPAAGVTISFPPNALTQTITVTMTALKGGYVAYDFQPHGIVFQRPVKITQELAGTGASALGPAIEFLHGAYFDQSLDLTTVSQQLGKVPVRETELGYFENNKGRAKFFIGHFSGYMFSSAKSDDLR